jgi:hypothetical protein
VREISKAVAVIAVWFTVAGIPTAAAESPVESNGEPGKSGDGGPAAAANLKIPFDNYPELAGRSAARLH